MVKIKEWNYIIQQIIDIWFGHYSVSGEHLCSVLVDDLDDARRLDPGLSVHLHGDPLLPQDGDLHLAALKTQQSRKQQLSDEPSCPFSFPRIECFFSLLDLVCPLLLDIERLMWSFKSYMNSTRVLYFIACGIGAVGVEMPDGPKTVFIQWWTIKLYVVSIYSIPPKFSSNYFQLWHSVLTKNLSN